MKDYWKALVPESRASQQICNLMYCTNEESQVQTLQEALKRTDLIRKEEASNLSFNLFGDLCHPPWVRLPMTYGCIRVAQCLIAAA